MKNVELCTGIYLISKGHTLLGSRMLAKGKGSPDGLLNPGGYALTLEREEC